MNNHYDLICYIVKIYKLYFKGEITLDKFVFRLLSHIQHHKRDYGSIAVLKFMKKLLKKSTWKTEYDTNCWIYKPDYPMPWLGCMLGDDYSFFQDNGRDKYVEAKSYVESKVYTPVEALEMIESRWDILSTKEIGYHSLKYCLVNTYNHQKMFVGVNVLRIIIRYLVVDIMRHFTIFYNRKNTTVKKEVVTEEGGV